MSRSSLTGQRVVRFGGRGVVAIWWPSNPAAMPKQALLAASSICSKAGRIEFAATTASQHEAT